jgi:hypothetical protein
MIDEEKGLPYKRSPLLIQLLALIRGRIPYIFSAEVARFYRYLLQASSEAHHALLGCNLIKLRSPDLYPWIEKDGEARASSSWIIRLGLEPRATLQA